MNIYKYINKKWEVFMKLILKRQILNEKLNIVSKALATKNIIPVLSGIKFELNNDRLLLTASNDDITIQAYILLS